MRLKELATVVKKVDCHVYGWEDASNDAHRRVLASVILACNHDSSIVLCEPSLARKTTRPPDVVVVDPIAGVNVIEVKGITLEQIEALEPGGQFSIRYADSVRSKNPFAQVRNAMFDIKDATQRASVSEVAVPFKYWVILANVSRSAWLQRWGDESFCPPELLFSEDVESLGEHIRSVGIKHLDNRGIQRWSDDQLEYVRRAFGDSSVLFSKPNERKPRRVEEGTLGELFDESAESYKALSDEQQELSLQVWDVGPRLIRGVAGSGKTVVLANNLARRAERELKTSKTLFDNHVRSARVAAICYNRTLVPFIKKKVEIAFEQRTGKPLPESAVEILSYNALMWHLSQRGLWRYQKVDDSDEATRATQYLNDLRYVKKNDPIVFSQCGYDAIYVDEGQDFLEDDFRLLKELVTVNDNDEPRIYVFYDDAQNLYGRQRPNWHSVGLNVVGRSRVMGECFRNTRQIVESAFNVLYGSFAESQSNVPAKAFGDIGTLKQKELIQQVDGVWRVHFARRDGLKPRVSIAQSKSEEEEGLVSRLRWLTGQQNVRPEDILILAFYRKQVERLAHVIRQAQLDIGGVHVAITSRDSHLHQQGWLTVSTVASAKGYDAHCTILMGTDEFPTDVQGRASFYVGCTRAIEYLEIMAHSRSGLVCEMEKAVECLE